jgi:NAD-dependent SIR2 family protein deacetylase
MILTPHDRLFVLTGAGVSAESGLATFRGSGGLWNGYRVDQVATPEAWHADPKLVWRFYSMRRRDALAAQPNAAHVALAKIEQTLGDRFYLCTQNVDDLHERGGSHRVHHMHGTLFASRCVDCGLPFHDQKLYEDANKPAHMRTVWRAGSPAHRVVRRNSVRYGRNLSRTRSGHALAGGGYVRFCISCCGVCPHRQSAGNPYYLRGPRGTSERGRLRRDRPGAGDRNPSAIAVALSGHPAMQPRLALVLWAFVLCSRPYIRGSPRRASNTCSLFLRSFAEYRHAR